MTIIGEGMRYVDRGSPAGYDFEVGVLTTNDTYQDLDCSAIVPKGAKAINFVIAVSDNLVNQNFLIRPKGNTTIFSRGLIYTQVANQLTANNFIVGCDQNRVVEYRASNTTWSTIRINVMGWFI